MTDEETSGGPDPIDTTTEDDSGPSETGPSGGRHRVRRTFSWILVVVACLLAVISVFAAFIRNQALDTDTYVSTVAPLASNPAIQTVVAKKVSERLVTQTNLKQQVEDALPPRAGFLAQPISSAVQTATNQVVLTVVQSDAFQKLWVGLNRRAHSQVVALLTGQQQGSFTTNNGAVTLDLSSVEAKVKQALDQRGITAFDKVSTANAPKLVLFQSSQLKNAQGMIRFFNHLVIVLPILAVLCFVGAILLALNHRKGLVRSAFALAISMALILVIAAVGRNLYLSSLDPSRSKPAQAAVIDTVAAGLLDTVRTVLVVAALVALIAFLVGRARVRSFLAGRDWPGWLTGGPVHDFVAAHRTALQWSVLGLALVVLVIWSNPTALVALVVVLVAIALVALLGAWAKAGSGASAAGGSADGGSGSRVAG